MIVRVNEVLNRTVVVVVDSDRGFNNLCGIVIFRVKVSCITSVVGIKLGILTLLVNKVLILLVVCQLSRDVIGYERLVMSSVHFDPSIVTVKQSFNCSVFRKI